MRKNYRHILCIIATAGMIALGIFRFPNASARLCESVRDIWTSLKFYVSELFGFNLCAEPTVICFSEKIPPVFVLPDDWGEVYEKISAYFIKCVSIENIKEYGAFLSGKMLVFSRITVIIFPFIIALVFLFHSYMNKENNEYDKDSRALTLYKRFIGKVISPVASWIKDMFAFINERKYYLKVWIAMWLLYFNIFTIIIEFIAYYLYFVAAFEVGTLLIQLQKLITDLSVMFRFVPLFVWAIIAFMAFDKIRKNVGYRRLMHFENRNKGFVSERPIVYMVCGTMGKRKTTAITDMALSLEAMFRDKAFEKITENDMKFPFFPWVNLENAIKTAMKYHEVYNLATVREYVRKKRGRWNKTPCRAKIYNYDYERYGLFCDDKLKVSDVWEVIEIYAQSYFIYVLESSLILSNYSIRTDGIMRDKGNFPLWDNDFFRRDSKSIAERSRYSHILDFDSLRLGKKMIENNLRADSFEFGVVVITEVGKERGNTLELSEKKKYDENANQKNDLFNSWLKMVRHSATVDGYPFVKVITDEQRPESWCADARDLCDIVHIAGCGETLLAMPCFALAELLYDMIFGRFISLYYKYRHNRSDNTLPMYLMKSVTAKINGYYTGIYNRFGYSVLDVLSESGTQDGNLKEGKYYLMIKKIYSKRFSTDCFSDFFEKKALRSPVGIDDLKEYVSEKASICELKEQNSYFINELINGLK